MYILLLRFFELASNLKVDVARSLKDNNVQKLQSSWAVVAHAFNNNTQ